MLVGDFEKDGVRSLTFLPLPRRLMAWQRNTGPQIQVRKGHRCFQHFCEQRR